VPELGTLGVDEDALVDTPELHLESVHLREMLPQRGEEIRRQIRASGVTVLSLFPLRAASLN
jgi:hypothetical protein